MKKIVLFIVITILASNAGRTQDTIQTTITLPEKVSNDVKERFVNKVTTYQTFRPAPSAGVRNPHSYWFGGSKRRIEYAGSTLDGIIDDVFNTPRVTYNIVFKIDELNETATLFDKYDPTNSGRSMWVRILTDGTVNFVGANTNTDVFQYRSGASIVDTGQWYALSIVQDFDQTTDNDKYRLYINGGDIGFTLYSNNPDSIRHTNSLLNIGSWYDSDPGNEDHTLDGWINQYGVYSDTMSFSQHKDWYNSGEPRYLSQVLPDSITELYANFEADSYNSEWSVKDSSSNDYTGTYRNGFRFDRDQNQNPIDTLPNYIGLIMGQSNFVSTFVEWDSLPDRYRITYDDCRIWDGDDIFENMDSTNNTWDDNGLGWSVEQYISDIADTLGRDIYLFKYVMGGSWLDSVENTPSWWPQYTTGRFNVVLTEIDQMVSFMANRHKDYEFKFIAWGQGESDSGDDSSGVHYYDNQKLFYDSLMLEMPGVDSIHFYQYLIDSVAVGYVAYRQVNEAKDSMVITHTPYFHNVDHSGLERVSEGSSHWDSPSMRILGARFRDAIIKDW